MDGHHVWPLISCGAIVNLCVHAHVCVDVLERERGQRQKCHDSLVQVGRAGAEKEQESVPRTVVLGPHVPLQEAV